MNGGMPRRRPRETGANGQPARETTIWDNLIGLLPILFLFLFPLLTSIFSGESPPSVPSMAFDNPTPKETLHRTMPKYDVNYYVDPRDVSGWTDYQFKMLDREAEVIFRTSLQRNCAAEMRTQQTLFDQAQGWVFSDPEKLRRARDYNMASCERLKAHGLPKR
jgi:DnaJ homolog subfamily B member 12